MDRLKETFKEEQNFSKKSEALRKKVLSRAFNLKMKHDASLIVVVVFFILFGAACWAGAAVGMHYFYAGGYEIARNLTDCTNLTSTVFSNSSSCCEELTAPLHTTAFVVSFFWLLYGLGIFLVAAFSLYSEFADIRVGISNVVALTIVLAFIFILIGMVGMWAIVPAWVYLNSLRGKTKSLFYCCVVQRNK
jgi:hypothetical protein